MRSQKGEDEMSDNQSRQPTIQEIREAHKRESDRISETIRSATVDQLQSGLNIFANDLTIKELQEKQHARLVSMTALTGVFRIFDAWELEDEQVRCLLGKPDDKTFANMQGGAIWSLPHDTLMRISYVFGIYKALRIIFPTEDRANAWPKKPNGAFNGASALDVMLKGRLADVRRYLDGQCNDESDSIHHRNNSA